MAYVPRHGGNNPAPLFRVELDASGRGQRYENEVFEMSGETAQPKPEEKRPERVTSPDPPIQANPWGFFLEDPRLDSKNEKHPDDKKEVGEAQVNPQTGTDASETTKIHGVENSQATETVPAETQLWPPLSSSAVKDETDETPPIPFDSRPPADDQSTDSMPQPLRIHKVRPQPQPQKAYKAYAPPSFEDEQPSSRAGSPHKETPLAYRPYRPPGSEDLDAESPKSPGGASKLESPVTRKPVPTPSIKSEPPASPVTEQDPSFASIPATIKPMPTGSSNTEQPEPSVKEEKAAEYFTPATMKPLLSASPGVKPTAEGGQAPYPPPSDVRNDASVPVAQSPQDVGHKIYQHPPPPPPPQNASDAAPVSPQITGFPPPTPQNMPISPMSSHPASPTPLSPAVSAYTIPQQMYSNTSSPAPSISTIHSHATGGYPQQPRPGMPHMSSDPSVSPHNLPQSPPPPYSATEFQRPGSVPTASYQQGPYVPPQQPNYPAQQNYAPQSPTGQPPMGQQPMGQPPMGSPPLGSPPMGQFSMGQPPPIGQRPQYPPQQNYAQQQPNGQYPMGQHPAGHYGPGGPPPLPPRPMLGQPGYNPQMPTGFGPNNTNPNQYPPPPRTHYNPQNYPPYPHQQQNQYAPPQGASRPGNSKLFGSVSAKKLLDKTNQLLNETIGPIIDGPAQYRPMPMNNGRPPYGAPNYGRGGPLPQGGYYQGQPPPQERR